MKKDCPVKEKGASAKQAKPRQDANQGGSSSATTATRVADNGTRAHSANGTASSAGRRALPYHVAVGIKDQRWPPEEERPEEIKQMLADASRMLKSMLAKGEGSATSGSSSAPSYESIQRQLDELKLKSLRVDSSPSEIRLAAGGEEAEPHRKGSRRLKGVQLRIRARRRSSRTR